MSNLRKCQRCGERTFEKMVSYSHCAHCLYTEDRWEAPESAYFKAMKDIAEIEATHGEELELNEQEQNETQDCA